ncbi:MAG: ATP-binding cassette domain-containing protein [Acidobacteria bacterium]|nr:ATP-binding cassette domain-containing protein [Acidobacteriota bacterium]
MHIRARLLILLDSITRLARAYNTVVPTSGKVLFNGEDLTGQPAYKFAQAGIAHAPEGRSVFATFTVDENLMLSFHRSLGRSRARKGLERAYALFPRLGERRKQIAGTLSGGEQRMLSLSRVLVEEPRLLIADELSLGLAPVVIDTVYESLEAIRAAGTSLLIVEQQLGPALALCDRVALLTHGTVTWEGESSQAREVVTAELFEPGDKAAT